MGATLGIVGAVVGAAGALYGGLAQKAQYDYQASVAKRNARLAKSKAEDARRLGAIEARQHQIQTALLIGQQRAAGAANGGVVDTGSLLDITSSTAKFGKLDELTALNNAERRARGFEAEAANFKAQQALLRQGGSQALVGSFFGAASAGLSGYSAGSQISNPFAGETTVATSASTVSPKWNFSGNPHGGGY